MKRRKFRLIEIQNLRKKNINEKIKVNKSENQSSPKKTINKKNPEPESFEEVEKPKPKGKKVVKKEESNAEEGEMEEVKSKPEKNQT